MDKRTLTIVLAVALIASFFLPFLGRASALDVVTSKYGDWQKYLLLIIPISGLLLLLGELNKGNYVVSRGLLSWLPLLTLLYFIIIDPLIAGAKFGDIIKYIGRGYGVGMWVAIVASVVLAFYNPKGK